MRTAKVVPAAPKTTPAVPARSARPARLHRVALLSAATSGRDNAGDALITDSVQRLLLDDVEQVILPLLEPLSEEQLEQLNACDVAVICGTNVYQRRFACNLTEDVLARISIPVVPLGVGASSALDTGPVMRRSDARAVRALHDHCEVGSARDPVTLDFLERIGVRNAALTGCPVLFHGGAEPAFDSRSQGPIVAAVRARLLHGTAPLAGVEEETLDRLCGELGVTLFAQSPYDLALTGELARRHQVPVAVDRSWGAGTMVDAMTSASQVVGFRLHATMLAISHGIRGSVVACDTRASSFCEMLGLPVLRIDRLDPDDVLARARGVVVDDVSHVPARWRELRVVMQDVLVANGLASPPG